MRYIMSIGLRFNSMCSYHHTAVST